jgi:hypothetical protein
MEMSLWTSPTQREGNEWFDGYEGQKLVLFDDFDKGQISFRLLLRLLDRYPMQVPIKGGFVEWCPRVIYITSNLGPARWYPSEDYMVLHRRLDVVQNMG